MRPLSEPPAPASPVLVEITGAVATITLNRPAALNAMDLSTKTTLLAALGRLHEDETIRAVVLTGAGRAFCVGQDLREHATNLESGPAGLGSSGLESTVRDHYNPILTAIATMPKPVIAAVNGVAAGAGMGFALAADLRVVADTASFMTAFAGIGLSPDSGLSWTLPRLVGFGRAAALLLLAEPISAQLALELGIATAVVPADTVVAAATELAARLAAGPTTAYAHTKQALAYAATADLADALEHEAALQQRSGQTRDHRAATAAFLAKQAPTFEGR